MEPSLKILIAYCSSIQFLFGLKKFRFLISNSFSIQVVFNQMNLKFPRKYSISNQVYLSRHFEDSKTISSSNQVIITQINLSFEIIHSSSTHVEFFQVFLKFLLISGRLLLIHKSSRISTSYSDRF